MGGKFDARKALREEIQGLESVRETFKNMVRRAQQKMGEAENELNDANKAKGFVDAEIERKRGVLAAEEEKNK
jgi:hypothetical protein